MCNTNNTSQTYIAWSDIRRLLTPMRQSVRQLISAILVKHKAEFISAPSRAIKDFAYEGGTMEASRYLARMAEPAARRFHLDGDVMAGAALLYFIGDEEAIRKLHSDMKRKRNSGVFDTIKMIDTAVEELLASNDETAKAALSQDDIDSLKHAVMCRDDKVLPSTAEAAMLRFLYYQMKQQPQALPNAEKLLQKGGENNA